MLEAHQVIVSSCTASVCIWLNKSRAAVHCPAFSQALIAALKTMVSATTWSLRMSPRRLKATCGRSTMRSQGEKRGDLAVSSINTDLAGHLTCGTCEDSECFKKCLIWNKSLPVFPSSSVHHTSSSTNISLKNRTHDPNQDSRNNWSTATLSFTCPSLVAKRCLNRLNPHVCWLRLTTFRGSTYFNILTVSQLQSQWFPRSTCPAPRIPHRPSPGPCAGADCWAERHGAAGNFLHHHGAQKLQATPGSVLQLPKCSWRFFAGWIIVFNMPCWGNHGRHLHMPQPPQVGTRQELCGSSFTWPGQFSLI